MYALPALGQTCSDDGGIMGELIMTDVKIPFMPDLIMRLLSGGTLRRADSNQKAGRKWGHSRSALDLIRKYAPRVHND